MVEFKLEVWLRERKTSRNFNPEGRDAGRQKYRKILDAQRADKRREIADYQASAGVVVSKLCVMFGVSRGTVVRALKEHGLWDDCIRSRSC